MGPTSVAAHVARSVPMADRDHIGTGDADLRGRCGRCRIDRHRATQPGAGQTALAAAKARQQAGAWVASQVSADAIVGCDPVMCGILLGRHVSKHQLLVLYPGRADPLRPDLVVATPAVRSELGARLASSYAPATLAAFGSGAARVDVRVVAPDGAVAYRAQLAADVRVRKSAGTILLDRRRIDVAAAARLALATGGSIPGCWSRWPRWPVSTGWTSSASPPTVTAPAPESRSAPPISDGAATGPRCAACARS